MRAVIDTNVLFEGLTVLGACSEVVDAWVSGRLTACVSTSLALEYEEVRESKLKRKKRELALEALPALLGRAEYVPIYIRVRPMSPDPDDDFVIECAVNARAVVVTRNRRDLIVAQRTLGIAVHDPESFIELLGG